MPITTPTKQLLVKLNRDELSDIILNDPVIIRCAEKLATKAPNVATASRNWHTDKKENGVKAREFQKVLNLFWTIDVSSKARRVLYAKQLNNKTPLPTSKDIILNNFLKKNYNRQ